MGIIQMLIQIILMDKMLEVPFFLNRGHRCGQVAAKSILSAHYPRKRFSLAELEKLMGHEEKQITLPIQVSYALHQLSVEHQYFVRPRFYETIMGELEFKEGLRSYYGPSAENLFKVINYPAVKKAAESLRGSKMIIERSERPKVEELAQALSENRVVVCLLNFDRFCGRPNNFRGHYVTLTEVNPEHGYILYHNSGPKSAGANRKASIRRFLESWNICFLDYDLIMSGKNNSIKAY